MRVAALPGPGQTVTGGTFSRHAGGKGGNQAVAAARLGARVTFVGAVGNDDHGRQALADLVAAGVDVSRALTLEGEQTGVALIVVDGQGENLIAVASGANAALLKPSVEETLVGWSPAGGSGAMLANFEIPAEAVLAGALIARQAGMRVVINPAPARPLEAALAELEPILVPNESEAKALSGKSDAEEAARSLAGQTGAPVVVTLGSDGALVVDGDRATRVAPFRVEPVDTTGAGDAFCGALAAELARGATVEVAARFASAAAALSVTVPGAREGLPDRPSVDALLERG